MRNCPTCGRQYERRFAFCPTDGTALVDEAAPERKLVPGGVIGWRAWDIESVGKIVRLGSVSHASIWPVGEYVTANCGGHNECYSSSDGRVPGENCTCGLYAARDFEHLTRELPYAAYHSSDDIKIIGEVAMAGKVIVGTQGWRAEKARIHKLYVPHTHWKLGKKLSETYGVEYELLRWIG